MRVLSLGLLLAACGSGETAFEPTTGWVLSPAQTEAQIMAGATLLDARELDAYQAEHVDGAVHAPWLEFSEQNEPIKGRLLGNDNVLGYLLRQKGVFSDRPVVVIGDPIEGWGEDGRIVWMLRTLGHSDVALVDGGHAALAAAGIAVSSDAPSPEEGDFVVRRSDQWSIDKATLKALVASPDGTKLVDNREAREYAGETPYGEARGGHLPGAVHLHYQELIGSDGRLLSRESIGELLQSKGLVEGDRLVAYCTGGVRSGWFVAVLTELGFAEVRNYAGSMWEWAAGPENEYPLEQ